MPSGIYERTPEIRERLRQAQLALPKRPVEDRLREKCVVDEAGCWIWIAAMDRHGYGVSYYEGRRQQAHRVAYQVFVGPIPKGYDLDHLCRVVACINPEHMEPVTHRENILRGQTLIARQLAKDVCPHGHPLDGKTFQNGKRGKQPKRYCKTCAKEQHARWVAVHPGYWRKLALSNSSPA